MLWMATAGCTRSDKSGLRSTEYIRGELECLDAACAFLGAEKPCRIADLILVAVERLEAAATASCVRPAILRYRYVHPVAADWAGVTSNSVIGESQRHVRTHSCCSVQDTLARTMRGQVHACCWSIQGAANGQASPVEDVGVNHRGFHILATKASC